MTQTANSVSPFNFGTHAVRVIVKDGAPWFVAKDICDTLGYSNSRKTLADHLDDDEKGVTNSDTLGGNQKLTIINESGLYALVLRSRKPEARKFAKWVTSEVLPAIRKTGQYQAPFSVHSSQTLSAEQAQTLRDMLTGGVARVPKEKQGQFMVQGWSKLKSHFGTDYRHIPASQYHEAVSILARHLTEFTAPAIDAPSVKNRRWLIEFDHTGREVAQPIAWDDCILKYEELPTLLASNDVMLASPLLADIATACLQRLARRNPAQLAA